MKIAISGADGFLGSHILNYLRSEDLHDVVGITLQPEDLARRYWGWNRLTIVPANQISEKTTRALDDVDAYLACAFPRATGEEGLAEGLSFVFESLAVLLGRGCHAVVNISSQSVYDPHRVVPAREGDKLLLTTAYAATKYCVELSVTKMCANMGVPATNVRMASLIGPAFDQRFVNKLTKTALMTREITIADNGSRFGYLDVRDAAEGLVRLLESTSSHWDEVYNLGPSDAYGISQIAEVVAAEVERCSPDGQRVIVNEVESKGVASCSAVDARKLCSFMSWNPTHALADSVRAIIEHEYGEH